MTRSPIALLSSICSLKRSPRARWLFVESPSRSIFLFEHDLFGKPVPTFPDHALAPAANNMLLAQVARRRINSPLEARL
jgi:hypothetical protein